MFCTQCGQPMEDLANFCPNCGATVTSANPQADRPAAQPKAEKKLMRPREDKWIAGVCMAFARYFEIDITLVRLLWAITIIFAGTGVLAYIICWAIIPREPLVYGKATPPQGYST